MADVIREHGLLAGELVGGYRLGPILGYGGFGQVYSVVSCQDGRPTDRVAVKMISPTTEKNAARAEREIKAMVKLGAYNHVLRIHAHGRVTDGRLKGWIWIAMERADRTLYDLCMETGHFRRVSDENANMIAVGVVRALRAAHANSTIHRDLKPVNVFLVKSVVKVGDFGLAAEVVGPDGEYYFAEQPIGSVHFMAPELFQSHARPRPESDVYALGQTMHWLLTGAYANARRANETHYEWAERVKRAPSAEFSPKLPTHWQAFVATACSPLQVRRNLEAVRRLVPEPGKPAPAIPREARRAPAPIPKPLPSSRLPGWLWSALRAILVVAFVALAVVAFDSVNHDSDTRWLVLAPGAIGCAAVMVATAQRSRASGRARIVRRASAILVVVLAVPLLFAAGVIWHSESSVVWLAAHDVPAVPPDDLGTLVWPSQLGVGDCLLTGTFEYRVLCTAPHDAQVTLITPSPPGGDTAGFSAACRGTIPANYAAYGVRGEFVRTDGELVCMAKSVKPVVWELPR
jgi:serine/threonine protein kinase